MPNSPATLAKPQSKIENPKSKIPKILFFTRILPLPGTNGSGAYSADLINYLQQHGCEVRVVWTETPDHLKYSFYNTLSHTATDHFDIRPHNCYRIGKHVFNPSAVWLPRKARLLYFLKRLLERARVPLPRNAPGAPGTGPACSEIPVAWDTPCTPTERAFLYDHAASFQPDILIANYPWMLAGVEKKHTAPVHWVQTNDYRFRRCMLTAEGHFTEALVEPEARAIERRWLGAADLLIAIQPNEAAIYAAEHPGKKILTACMSVTGARAFQPADGSAAPSPTVPIIAFIGSNHIINQRSALWFVQHVWPLILRDTPNARLRVAGRVCDSLAQLKHNERPRIELLGQVPDLATFYAGAAIAIVPILEGSGVKIKLIEAIAHNRATVTTSVGIDGLEILRPAIAVADTPETFAAATARLLTDIEHRDRIAAEALALAQTHLSPAANYAPVLAAARAATVDLNRFASPTP